MYTKALSWQREILDEPDDPARRAQQLLKPLIEAYLFIHIYV